MPQSGEFCEHEPPDYLQPSNQALSARHGIVYALARNEMPPHQGISDASAREHLLKLAENFAQIGDRALAFEGQRPP